MTLRTPGPWKASVYDQNGNFHIVYHTDGMTGGGEPIGNRPIPATMENLRLLSAAPELLETLKELLYDIEDMILCKQGHAPIWDENASKARAAIAKAEGSDA